MVPKQRLRIEKTRNIICRRIHGEGRISRSKLTVEGLMLYLFVVTGDALSFPLGTQPESQRRVAGRYGGGACDVTPAAILPPRSDIDWR